MKFLIDESVEYPVVLFLREHDHDVVSIAEKSPSLDDKSILTAAFEQKRILITNDKDFGELVFRQGMPHRGVILFRLDIETSQSKIKRLKVIIEKFEKRLRDCFIVVTHSQIRFRK